MYWKNKNWVQQQFMGFFQTISKVWAVARQRVEMTFTGYKITQQSDFLVEICVHKSKESYHNVHL